MTATDGPISYKASEMNASLDKEIARLREQARWGWAKEARNLAGFGLRDGMAILELGSGPGFITAQLLELYPHSHITCIEIDPALTESAEQFLQGQGWVGHYTIVQGDLMQMAFAAGSFDFAVARFVFQHLPDPPGALAAIQCVLKPGGTLVIHDVDTGLGEIVEPRSAEATALENRMITTQEQRGGNPAIGRQLWRLMAAAGYTNLDLEVVPIHTDVTRLTAIFPTEWDPGAYKAALDLGLLSAADLETLRQDHINFHASPDKYALFVSLMVSGQKAADPA